MTDPEMEPGAAGDDAELRARWRRMGAPLVETVPNDDITGVARDKVSVAIDQWLRGEVCVRRGDPEPDD